MDRARQLWGAGALRDLRCGGRLDEEPPPRHWHDRLAARWGYPRLSCQITVDRPLTVFLLPEKRVWGSRQP